MARIVTQEQLQDKVDNEIAWRKKELKVLNDHLPDSNSPIQKAMLRCALTLLYAHWEGYVKKVCEYYLEYVSNRIEYLRDLKPTFIAIAIKRHLADFEQNSFVAKSNIISFILENLDEKKHIPFEGIIKTKSNLKYEVFRDISHIVNLDLEKFKSYETLINDLVDKRNKIAHGEGHSIDLKTYRTMYYDIIETMEVLRTEIENAVALNSHRI